MNDGRQAKWQINTGEPVLQIKTGRRGRAVLVRRDEVMVRWGAGEKAISTPREGLMPFRTVLAFREVDEDEANAAAFREEMSRQYELVGWTTEMAYAEREQEAAGFLSGMDR